VDGVSDVCVADSHPRDRSNRNIFAKESQAEGTIAMAMLGTSISIFLSPLILFLLFIYQIKSFANFISLIFVSKNFSASSLVLKAKKLWIRQ
jgi:hypothetical protein